MDPYTISFSHTSKIYKVYFQIQQLYLVLENFGFQLQQIQTNRFPIQNSIDYLNDKALDHIKIVSDMVQSCKKFQKYARILKQDHNLMRNFYSQLKTNTSNAYKMSQEQQDNEIKDICINQLKNLNQLCNPILQEYIKFTKMTVEGIPNDIKLLDQTSKCYFTPQQQQFNQKKSDLSYQISQDDSLYNYENLQRSEQPLMGSFQMTYTEKGSAKCQSKNIESKENFNICNLGLCSKSNEQDIKKSMKSKQYFEKDADSILF